MIYDIFILCILVRSNPQCSDYDTASHVVLQPCHTDVGSVAVQCKRTDRCSQCSVRATGDSHAHTSWTTPLSMICKGVNTAIMIR